MKMDDFPSILQPSVKLFSQAVKLFSQGKIGFTACKSSYTKACWLSLPLKSVRVELIEKRQKWRTWTT
jgi:hypothetical protein